MSYDIAALRKRGAEVPIPFYGADISATYDPIKVGAPSFRSDYEARRKELQAEAGDAIIGILDQLKAAPLREDFPAVDILAAEGCETLGDVPRDVEALTAIQGIDEAMARRIIRAINTDERIDPMEVERARWRVYAELAVMLVKDWNLTEGSEPLPVTVDVFTSGQVPPELALSIIEAVWADVGTLGNPTTSNGTKPGSRRG